MAGDQTERKLEEGAEWLALLQLLYAHLWALECGITWHGMAWRA